MKIINFNPKNCINCLSCMRIEKCRILIDMIRRGGQRFGEDECMKNKCTKCIDSCSYNALTLKNKE